MSKKKKTTNAQRIVEELKKLPNSIWDERHHLWIVFDDDRARSNQGRFEHIAKDSHHLTPKDIKSIPKGIEKASLKKEKGRKDTYNFFYPRKATRGELIQISVIIKRGGWLMAKVKTIFIAKKIK